MRNKRLCKTMTIGISALALTVCLVYTPVMNENYGMSLVYATERDAKTELGEILETAKSKDLMKYTDKSSALLKSVIAVSEKLYNDTTATESDLEWATELLEKSVSAIRTKQENVVYDGEYTINGQMWHAAQNQASMGNAALIKPMKIIKEGDDVTLELEFAALQIGNFSGYLYKLYYFPDWTDKNTIPYTATPTELTVIDHYDGIYDSYNDPDKGTDSLAKGNLYPRHMTMPVKWMDDEVWVQVYVPIMEGINKGSGLQHARLQLNWSTLIQTKGVVTDKSTLVTYIQSVSGILDKMNEGVLESTEEQKAMVSAVLEAGQDIQSDMNATQAEINGIVKVMKEIKQQYSDTKEDENTNEIKVTAVSAVDKSSLHMMLLAATSIVGRNNYTTASIKTLKGAIEQAEAVYQNSDATQESVNQQISELSLAIVGLEAQTALSTTTTTTTEKENTTLQEEIKENTKEATVEQGTDATSDKLDIHKLEDGVYAIQGSMVKMDKKTSSMANEAINHSLKLTVKNGKYKISLVFSGLTVSSQKGYLGKLKYFKTGYQLDAYGLPTGDLGNTTIDSYQEDSTGKRMKDSFGTDYPKQVTFPLIPEALEDGYVPLQVFVPIMDSISKGTGTQAVFLKLDLDSVKSATKDDESFTECNKDEESKVINTDTGTKEEMDNETTTTTNAGGVGSQSLPTSGNTGDAKVQSSLESNASALAEAESVVLTSTVEEQRGALADAKPASNIEEQNTGTLEVKKDAINETIANENTTNENGAKEDAVPFFVSIVVALAGVFYKAKSAGVFRKK